MHDSPKSSPPSATGTSDPTAKAPAGWVKDDATRFLDDLSAEITAAQPVIEAFEGRDLTREEVEYERHLCAALMRQASLNLHHRGLRVIRWLPDGRGLGYHIEARYRQGRKFEVEFHYETLDRPDLKNRADLGRAVLDEVVGTMVKVQDAYMARLSTAREDLGAAVTTRKAPEAKPLVTLT